MKQLTVISEKCIACGKCYLNFPEVFDCHDDGIAYVQKESSSLTQKASERAIHDCPTKAIQWTTPLTDDID